MTQYRGVLATMMMMLVASAASAKDIMIRCQTTDPIGGFSVVAGTVSERGIEGVLTRSEAHGTPGTQFDITAAPVSEFSNPYVTYQMTGALEMTLSDGSVVAWEHPTFKLSKSVAINHRGGMSEQGILRTAQGSTRYVIEYRCIGRDI